MLTPKQIRAKKRILRKRQLKADNRKRFLVKLASRRGLSLANFPCQEGHTQIVSDVIQAGNAYFYKSCACAGCPAGKDYIERTTKGTPEEVLGCEFVKEQVLLSLTEIKKGDRVEANSPAKEIKLHMISDIKP